MASFGFEIHQLGVTSCGSNSADINDITPTAVVSHFDCIFTRDALLKIGVCRFYVSTVFETVRDCFVFKDPKQGLICFILVCDYQSPNN